MIEEKEERRRKQRKKKNFPLTSYPLFQIENEGMEGETPSPAVMRTIKIQPTEHLKKVSTVVSSF